MDENATTPNADGASPDDLIDRVSASLAQGREKLRAGDATAAAECAQAGLSLLGDAYLQDDVEDDTDLTLFLASDNIDHGQVAEGAEIMLQVLEERVDSYAEAHTSGDED